MSVVRFSKPENKLAKLVFAPGGKTIEAAVEDAEIELGTLSGACLADIDERLAHLVAACEEGRDAWPPEAVERFYADAREIVAVSNVADLPAVGAVAHSLCLLLDGFGGAGRWSREGFRVHVSALQLFRARGGRTDDAVGEAVLASLRDLVERQAGG